MPWVAFFHFHPMKWSARSTRTDSMSLSDDLKPSHDELTRLEWTNVQLITVIMASMILLRHSCSYVLRSPLGISAVLIQNSWNEDGVKFWSLTFFTMFKAVAGPSSCRPPPWGTPSTMWATASLNSRRRTPWASNLTPSVLKSSRANRATSAWGTLRTKHPWPTPLGSGTIPRSPSIKWPAGKTLGSQHLAPPQVVRQQVQLGCQEVAEEVPVHQGPPEVLVELVQLQPAASPKPTVEHLLQAAPESYDVQ